MKYTYVEKEIESMRHEKDIMKTKKGRFEKGTTGNCRSKKKYSDLRKICNGEFKQMTRASQRENW